jgi:hypothetical protein
MKPIVDLPGQMLFWSDLGEPLQRAPTREEIEAALVWAAKMAVAKRHRGCPPHGMSYDDLRQEVMSRTMKRLTNFRHGGKKTLQEFSYVSSCWALIDIQNENMKRPIEVQSYPLFEK